MAGIGYLWGLCTHFMVCNSLVCLWRVPMCLRSLNEAQKDSGEVTFYHRLWLCYRRSTVAMQHTGSERIDRKMCVQ